MDVKLAEFKRKLLDTGLFRKVSGEGQYKCKTCPYCGDMHDHMYVLIKQQEDVPVLYKCFKCNASGILNEKFLDYFGIEGIDIPRLKGRKKIQMNGASAEVIDLLDVENDADMIRIASDYIEQRVGIRPSLDDLRAFQVIGNPVGYLKAYISDDTWGMKDRVWFRMNNGSMAGRSLDDGASQRWRKRTVVGTSGGLYSIKQSVSVDRPINICICEGVMDAIGLYYHANVMNAVFVACMGSMYEVGMAYALDAGIFGDSVNIRIYKDADIQQVRINRKYMRMFKSIGVYRNILGKDFGLKSDQIEIEKCSL